MKPPVVEHLERHLGEAAGGWSGPSPIKVLRFPNQPEDGVVTYATLGLSDTVLPMSGGRAVRLELLLAARASFDGDAVAAALGSFADYVVGQRRALLRGDVIGPSAPLVPGVKACGVYAAIPVLFPEGLATLATTTPPTVFVWLLPVPAGDVAFVKSRGWEAFEDYLERNAVDFWDLNRTEIPGR